MGRVGGEVLVVLPVYTSIQLFQPLGSVSSGSYPFLFSGSDGRGGGGGGEGGNNDSSYKAPFSTTC